MRCTVCLLTLMSIVYGPLVSAKSEGQFSVKYDFEADGLAGWMGTQGLGSIDQDEPHSGKGCLLLQGPPSGGGAIYQGVALPVADPPRARTVRISLWVKTKDVDEGNLTLQLLKCFDPPREPEWFNYISSTFATVPVSGEWTRFEATGSVRPDVRGLNFYISLGCPTRAGEARIDDVAIELLDRGVMFDRDRERTIISADRATIELIVSSPQDLNSGHLRMVDEEDRVRATIPVTAVARQPIKLPTRGYYVVSARVEYNDGVTCVAQTPVAVVGPLIGDEERMKSPFGLTGGGELFFAAGARWDRPHVNLNHDAYKQAADAGFPSTRPTPVTGELPKDRSSIYCFWPQPPWLQDRQGQEASGVFDMYPMKDWDVFRKLIQYVVKSVPGRIEYVEVANEPDTWKGPLEGLVRYHREMAEAVKSVSPETKVIGPCPCTIKIEFLDLLNKLGLFEFLDGLVVHAYVRATAPEGEFIELVRKLKVFMASIGRGELPIFITEYGWTVPPGDWQTPVDPLTQARYVSRSLILLTAEQIDAMLYFCMRWADPHSGAAGYGLLNWEFTPRPSYAAYANTVRCLTGASGPGRCLRVTPTTYLTLFRKGPGVVAAAWDVEGKSTVFLPKPISMIRDMTGRPIEIPENATIPVGPSPIFAEISDADFYDIALCEARQARQGSEVKVPFSPLWAPPPLTFQGETVHVPREAARGEYLVLGKQGSRWQAAPVKVTAPLEIASVEMHWPASERRPQLHGAVRSHLDDGKSIDFICRVTLPALTNGVSVVKMSLKGEAEGTFSAGLAAIRPGERYRGHVTLIAKELPGFRPEKAIDLTWVPCYAVADGVEDPDWKGIVAMDVSAWGPFRGIDMQPGETDRQDCSAHLQTVYNDVGIHFRVCVRDNHHTQVQAAHDMWREDSVQLAFDLDAEQPWRPNEGGFDGHFRIFEYGAALGKEGPMTWRWISYDKTLPGSTEEKRVRARVTRAGDVTTYDLTFPWVTLGLQANPASGSKIGFALAVNDVDEMPTRRSGLTVFGGIVDKKDPTAFGTLWLR